mgnify:CR=1 FL=1
MALVAQDAIQNFWKNFDTATTESITKWTEDYVKNKEWNNDSSLSFNQKAIINEALDKVLADNKQEICSKIEVERVENLMNRLGLSKDLREVARVAIDKKEECKEEVMAIELKNGKMITGKQSDLLSAASAMLINALKEINKIPDDVYLLSADILEKILQLKKNTSYRTSYCLNVQEVLIALSICSSINPIIEKTLKNIDKLHGTEAHSTYIIEKSEVNVLKNLGINLTCEAKI